MAPSKSLRSYISRPYQALSVYLIVLLLLVVSLGRPLNANTFFIRGDVTADGSLHLADPIKVLHHVILGDRIPCESSADADDSGQLDLTDGIFLLHLLFLDGSLPPSPFPVCGLDPTEDLLTCRDYSICQSGDGEAIDASGASFVVRGPNNQELQFEIGEGIFQFSSSISFKLSEELVRHHLDTDTTLPTFELSLDARDLNSLDPGGTLSLQLTDDGQLFPQAPEFLADFSLFFEVSGQVYFWPIEATKILTENDEEKWQAQIPASLFANIREWGLVGREGSIDGRPIFVEEFLEGQEVLLSRDGEQVLGQVEYLSPDQLRIRTVLNSVLREFTLDIPQTPVTLKIQLAWVEHQYQASRAAFEAVWPTGQLYRASPIDRTLETPEEFLPVPGFDLGESSPVVLIHGWDFNDPFKDLFQIDGTQVQFQAFDVWQNEAEARQHLENYWAHLLDEIYFPGAEGIYLYAFNPYSSLEENAQKLSSVLESHFNWSQRTEPLTLLTHSNGTLLAVDAIDHTFPAGQNLPESLRIIALETPFRGTPYASPSFQQLWLAENHHYARSTLSPYWRSLGYAERRVFPIEVLTSFTHAALFFRTHSSAAEVWSFDQSWLKLSNDRLDASLFAVGSDLQESPAAPLSHRLLENFLSHYQDEFNRHPFSESDGIVPLASQLRRKGAASEFWFDLSTISPKETILAGSWHGQGRNASELQDHLGLGVGSRTTRGGYKLLYIPPTSFLMGSSASEPGHRPDEIRHQVNLTRGFFMGATEVTQKDYREVLGSNPSFFTADPSSDSFPVEGVSWDDAVLFCESLTARERQAGTIRSDEFFRLPTEAEWECMARAGTTSSFFFGEASSCSLFECSPCPPADSYLLWCANSNNSPAPVKSKPVNAWGFYGVHGNVAEWCQDNYGSYSASEVDDPTGPSEGILKVIRGGSWFTDQLQSARSAARGKSLSTIKGANFGFRIVLDRLP